MTISQRDDRRERRTGGAARSRRWAGTGAVAAVSMASVAVVVSLVVAETGWTFAALDEEHGLAAALSAAALVLTGAVCAWVGRLVGPARSFGGVGALLVFMAADEWFVLHERLESAVGVDWQRLYAPVMAAAGAAWLLVLRRHKNEIAFSTAWVAGAAFWGAAQLLELVQWNGSEKVALYTPLMVTEEVAELVGTLAFLAAAVVLVRRRPSGRTGGRRGGLSPATDHT